MKAKRKTMTIRPGKEYSGLIDDLEQIAKTKKWSLNKFVLVKLEEVRNKFKKSSTK